VLRPSLAPIFPKGVSVVALAVRQNRNRNQIF
jgi:hypothetical protein